ncbi:MFS transporter, ACS family, tartrate transporter [Arthrobacter sp. cf158]|uniref:MFS transporter n=1 Tax=Arthrobacter sp. cf158 TaxID=1761744 RepID=UPI000896CBDC|nr:MFS transporter [Arthrobacter sp. cf158]SDX49103.1 MFS transporter, ACS family, tartrate transporter [Arthrobacter sp. cf158]
MSTSTARPRVGDATVRKIKFRILPLLVILYIIAFIDRANVGFVAKEMNADLGITTAQFGLAAGLFSIGYFLFEVPSNILMRKVGARRWIARILVSWGIVAVACGFVQDFTQLAIIRTLLGVAEAGFFPCVILYLSFWFPERERARVVALFMIALPLATVIAAPLSGLILDNVHWAGMESWRWVFILQGAPAVILAAVTLFVLVDAPAKAKWLTTEEKAWLETTLQAERDAKVQRHGHVSFWRSLAGGRVLALSLIYYSKSVAIYVLAFFTPQIIAAASTQLSNTAVGYINAVPYGIAAIVMVYWARHSDKKRERRWHVGIPLIAAGGGLALMPFAVNNLILSIVLLTVITVAVYATYGPFWSLPSLFLTGQSAAVGLAAINSLANLGGFIGPFAFGALKDSTGSNNWGLAMVSATCLIAAAMVVGLKFVKQAEATARIAEEEADAKAQLVTTGDTK